MSKHTGILLMLLMLSVTLLSRSIHVPIGNIKGSLSIDEKRFERFWRANVYNEYDNGSWKTWVDNPIPIHEMRRPPTMITCYMKETPRILTSKEKILPIPTPDGSVRIITDVKVMFDKALGVLITDRSLPVEYIFAFDPDYFDPAMPESIFKPRKRIVKMDKATYSKIRTMLSNIVLPKRFNEVIETLRTYTITKEVTIEGRASLFTLLANVVGVPARFVKNDTFYFSEVQLPDGRWKAVDLEKARTSTRKTSSSSGISKSTKTNYVLKTDLTPPRGSKEPKTSVHNTSPPSGTSEPARIDGNPKPASGNSAGKEVNPVKRIPTNLKMINPPSKLEAGKTCSLKCKLTGQDKRPIEGKRMMMSLKRDKTYLTKLATTDKNGMCEFKMKIPPIKPGDYKLSTAFGGDKGFQPSSVSMKIPLVAIPELEVSYEVDSNGATITGELRYEGKCLANKKIIVASNKGTKVLRTDKMGRVEFRDDFKGDRTYQATFPGDKTYKGVDKVFTISTAKGVLKIIPGCPKEFFLADAVPLDITVNVYERYRGKMVQFKYPVDFSVSLDTHSIGTLRASNGVGKISIPEETLHSLISEDGIRTVKITFMGTKYYNPAEASTELTIYGEPKIVLWEDTREKGSGRYRVSGVISGVKLPANVHIFINGKSKVEEIHERDFSSPVELDREKNEVYATLTFRKRRYTSNRLLLYADLSRTSRRTNIPWHTMGMFASYIVIFVSGAIAGSLLKRFSGLRFSILWKWMKHVEFGKKTQKVVKKTKSHKKKRRKSKRPGIERIKSTDVQEEEKGEAISISSAGRNEELLETAMQEVTNRLASILGLPSDNMRTVLFKARMSMPRMRGKISRIVRYYDRLKYAPGEEIDDEMRKEFLEECESLSKRLSRSPSYY